MDRKGANTFPFYKSTSRTERHLKKGILLCFCPFHVGEHKRRWRLLLTATFREPAKKQSVLFPPITDTKHTNLIPYKEHVLTLLPHFENITFEHFPREENQLADALATMSL